MLHFRMYNSHSERLKFLGVFKYTVIRPQNAYTKQLLSSIVLKYLLPKPSEIGNKRFIYDLLVFDPPFAV